MLARIYGPSPFGEFPLLDVEAQGDGSNDSNSNRKKGKLRFHGLWQNGHRAPHSECYSNVKLSHESEKADRENGEGIPIPGTSG